MDEQLLLKVGEVTKRTGLGRTKIYELIAAGQLEAVHIGKAVRVPVSALEEFVEHLRVEQVAQ
jgi:excisionase family DNA binding protein